MAGASGPSHGVVSARQGYAGNAGETVGTYAALDTSQRGTRVETRERIPGSNEIPADRRAEEQLTRLMLEHERPLYAFLYSLLSDPSGVHDCLQDTYMRAYLQLRDGGRVETAWLYRVGYNRAMDELRRRWRSKTETVEAARPGGDIDRRLAIEEALSHLSLLDRQVLFLYGYAGFKTDEIGILLGTSGAAVRQRLYRARDRVRRLYEEA
jgi:RNA polymerase sigma-70 factor, ECF subfamily